MIVILVVLDLLSVMAAIALWPWAPLLPSFGLAAVLLAARRAPVGRYRWIALLAGVLEGSLWPGAMLVAPAVLLLLGALASGTRLLFPVERWRGLLILGTIHAGLQACLLRGFAGSEAAVPSGVGGAALATGGVLLTGLIFAAADEVLDRAPFLRHALERP